MKKPARFVFIDGNALVHRAYHALPPLSQAGEPTNAVYGFTSVLLKVIRELKPDYMIATFDLAAPTFRHEEFAEYKAHRPKTPDDLISQFAKVKEVVGAFGIPIYEKEGYEADDMIGTLTRVVKEKEKDAETIIITGDLDTLQLVDDVTKVYTLKKGISDTVIYDEKAVRERFGLAPEQMNDFKGLKGDPSDNIPGVPGIGEKTAASLLTEYHSLESVYDNIALIPEKLRKKLVEHKDQAFFSKKLATIKRDVPISFSADAARFGGYDKEKAEAVFKKFGFTSLIPRIHGDYKRHEERATPVVQAQPGDVKAFAAASVLAVHLRDDSVLVANEQGRFAALSYEDAAPLLANEKIKKIGHDFKTMIHALAVRGIMLVGIDFDIHIAAYLLSAGEKDYSLFKIAIEHVDGELSRETCEAAAPVYIMRSYRALEEKLRKEGMVKLFSEIEMPLIPILAAMESAGIKVEKKKLADLSHTLEKEKEKAQKTIWKLAGEEFNIDSPIQLSKILFEKIGIAQNNKVKKTKTGMVSTRAGELERYQDAHPIVADIIRYRELAKLKSTYADALLELVGEDGRIHTSYSQVGTATGRLASSEPNLQNIPQRSVFAEAIREAFVADEGYTFAAFDFSQIELRIIASLSGDPTMIEIFNTGGDVHRATAAAIENIDPKDVTPEMRNAAKALNFGILYGMGQKGFADAAGIDMKKAKHFIDDYFRKFSSVAAFLERTKEHAKKYGFVQTLLGRKRWLPDIASPNWLLRQAAERMAQNMPVQGLQADIIKMAMVRINKDILSKRTEDDVRLLLQIHDELLFEMKDGIVDAVYPQIKRIMESVYALKVPIVVHAKAGNDLAHLKEL